MQHNQLAVDPNEIIYALRMSAVQTVLVNRLGSKALALTEDDLHLVREEVCEGVPGKQLSPAAFLDLAGNFIHWKSRRQR